jgi:hypothetical protein
MPVAEGFPYRRIIDDLRDQILSGHRAPGERMPSEHERPRSTVRAGPPSAERSPSSEAKA